MIRKPAMRDLRSRQNLNAGVAVDRQAVDLQASEPTGLRRQIGFTPGRQAGRYPQPTLMNANPKDERKKKSAAGTEPNQPPAKRSWKTGNGHALALTVAFRASLPQPTNGPLIAVITDCKTT